MSFVVRLLSWSWWACDRREQRWFQRVPRVSCTVYSCSLCCRSVWYLNFCLRGKLMQWSVVTEVSRILPLVFRRWWNYINVAEKLRNAIPLITYWAYETITEQKIVITLSVQYYCIFKKNLISIQTLSLLIYFLPLISKSYLLMVRWNHCNWGD